MAENEEDRRHPSEEGMKERKGLDLCHVFVIPPLIYHACSQSLACVWRSAQLERMPPSPVHLHILQDPAQMSPHL